MTTPPSFGSAPTWSSSAPTVATNPRLVASSAMAWAKPSAVPRLEPYSTSKRRVVRVRAGRRRRSGLRRCGRRAPSLSPAAMAVRPARGLTLMWKSSGLIGERLLGLELVVGEVDELEPLQEHAQHEDGLLQGELPADAGALPGAERLVGVRRDLGSVLGAEAVRVELLRVRRPTPACRGAASPMRTIAEVSFSSRYLPPMTVSSYGWRVNAGAVGHSRSVSSRIWATYGSWWIWA